MSEGEKKPDVDLLIAGGIIGFFVLFYLVGLIVFIVWIIFRQ